MHDDPSASGGACSGWCTCRLSLQVGSVFFFARLAFSDLGFHLSKTKRELLVLLVGLC